MYGKGLFAEGTQNHLAFCWNSILILFFPLMPRNRFYWCRHPAFVFSVDCGLSALPPRPDTFGTLVCRHRYHDGFHVLINGMTIGIMPVTGLPLPLCPMGQFIADEYDAIGLILNIGCGDRIHVLIHPCGWFFYRFPFFRGGGMGAACGGNQPLEERKYASKSEGLFVEKSMWG